MNNIIKKIISFAVAITLTGTGTLSTKLIRTKSDILLKANASITDYVRLNDNTDSADVLTSLIDNYISSVHSVIEKISEYTRYQNQISFRFASKEEGKELMLSNKEYYDGFSQNELEYKMQKKNAEMEEYLSFAGDQVMEFTDYEKAFISSHFKSMESKLRIKGYTLPPIDEIVLIKTTMQEEGGAAGYTHGTQIYIQDALLEGALNGSLVSRAMYIDYLDKFFWHELFHCLTRNNPDFRTEMYKLIHFTVAEEDFALPPSVFEYHISNPDVEHHNAYASFHIGDENIDCFIDSVTTKHFEEGETFFEFMTPVLVPTDGSDIYYMPEQSDNFYDIFGRNTDYVDDPEECMADNFSYALKYGIIGENGNGYPNPEIIEGILSYLRK